MVNIEVEKEKLMIVDGKAVSQLKVRITADTVAEIPEAGVDWAAGSRCDVIEEDESYVLGNDREWHNVHFFDSGGSNAPVTLSAPMTQEEYDALETKDEGTVYFICDSESEYEDESESR